MEDNNEPNVSDDKKFIKYIIASIIMLIWVFGIGGLNAAILDNNEYNKRNHCSSSSGPMVIEGFNSTFTSYQGEQTGSQVKALIQRLIANSKTYEDDVSRIPSVSYNSSENESNHNKPNDKTYYAVTSSDLVSNYQDYLSTLSKGLDLKHTYCIVITLNGDGNVEGITINYDADNESANFILPKKNETNTINGLKCVPELKLFEVESQNENENVNTSSFETRLEFKY